MRLIKEIIEANIANVKNRSIVGKTLLILGITIGAAAMLQSIERGDYNMIILGTGFTCTWVYRNYANRAIKTEIQRLLAEFKEAVVEENSMKNRGGNP